MDEAQKQLIQTVCSHFIETAEWPRTAPLQVRLRQLGNIGKLAAEVGKDLIGCDRHSELAESRLTLRGLALCDEAQPDIERLLWTIRAVARTYIERDAPKEIKLSEVVAELGLSEIERRRLAELIRIAPGAWHGLVISPSGEVTLMPHQDIWCFEEVQTLEALFEADRRAKEDEQAASSWGLGAKTGSPAASTRPPTLGGGQHRQVDHVHQSRIEELRAIDHPDFDLRRLIAFCEELNVCVNAGAFFATAMLTRAIIDHVPPIFGCSTFVQVSSSYAGSKSFKASMQHLQASARHIADAHLHVQIRQKEGLPTSAQVNFSNDLDVLLEEIVRILS